MRAPWSFLPAPMRPVLALCVLHLLCVLPFPWEEVDPWSAILTISPDLMLVLGGGLVLSLLLEKQRLVAWMTTAAFLLVPVYRIGWSVVPTFLQKPFDLYNDILLLSSLEHLLTQEFDATQRLLIFIGSGLLFALIWFLLQRLMICALGGRSPRRGWRFGVLLLFQLVLVADWLAPADSPLDSRRLYSVSLYGHALGEGRKIVDNGMWRYRKHWEQRVTASLGKLQEIHSRKPERFVRLQGCDIYLFFIESYGRIAIEDPRADRLPSELKALQGELFAKGWVGGSTWIHPSISGGQSSLAHAELLSGIRIEWRRILYLLLGSLAQPLPKQLAQHAGYHTINVQPAMTRPWPDSKRFFGFEEDIFQAELDYEGRAYPWGKMPDQYVLARLLRDVVPNAKKPLFCQFISVTSHFPFAETPAYIEDWGAAATSEAHAGEPGERFDISFGSYHSHPKAFEAYSASIRYSLRSALEFCRRLERPSLVLILGDHQPPGLGAEGSTNFDVPLHILCNRLETAALFSEWKLAPGLIPAADHASFSSSEFLYRFLEATSR